MPTNNISSMSSSLRSNKFLLWFFLCCSLPFVAAKLALEFSWFTAGVGSRGQWLESEIQLLPQTAKSNRHISNHQASNQQELQPHWRLVYVPARQCDSACELALYTMQQLYFGLAGQQENVGLTILADQIPQQLSDFPAINWQAAHASLNSFHNQIFIVNRQGIAILRYTAAQDRQQMLQISKDIRKDLRRLLAFDRGGA